MGEKLCNSSSPGREAETTVAHHATGQSASGSPADAESGILALGRFVTGRRTHFPQPSTTVIMAASKHAAMLCQLTEPLPEPPQPDS